MALQRNKLGQFLKGRIGLKRENNPNWKGGQYIDVRGDVRLLMPGHLRADPKGYIREGIFLAERAFGKMLPMNAVVHHHSRMQLVICENQAYHLLLHKRKRHLNGFIPKRKRASHNL